MRRHADERAERDRVIAAEHERQLSRLARRAHEPRDLVADNLRAFEDLARVNRARARAGSIAPLESTRSDVAMLQFRSIAVRADLDLTTALAKLRNLLGRSPADPLDVSGSRFAGLARSSRSCGSHLLRCGAT